MTQKELKRLSRSDLLEMLLELSKENEVLRKENKNMRTQLADRTIALESSGSLAEAALRLNGIFQAADAACAQYTQNIHARHADLEEHCRQIEQETIERCKKKEEDTRKNCDFLLAQAQAHAQTCLENAKKQAESLQQKYRWLLEIVDSGEKNENE